MLRGSLLLLLLILPLHAAGEVERERGFQPAIESTSDGYVAGGPAELATALRLAVAGTIGEDVSSSRHTPARARRARPAPVRTVAVGAGAAGAASSLSPARQRGLLPWSTAPPALA